MLTFVAHVAALPGNPYDGHTLATVLPAITRQIGTSLTRVIADAGYRGHKAPQVKGMRVSIRPARNAASPSRSSANCGAARRPNR
jgi:IS5 family transposase